jgi:EmrB/QacA subfamily drug resistance transporter
MATETSPAPAASSGEVLSSGFTHRQILTILTGLLLGMFLAALDQTIVSTSIRSIGDDLHGLSAQAWVTTSFLITSTLTTPIYGKLSDIYGRKRLFLTAIAIFIVGSAMCGLATSMYMLAAFRAFQGLGAGGLFSLAIAILADIVSPQERPRYMGYTMSTFASASVLGPVIGGLLSGQASILGITGWRWIFYVNVPIGIVALIVVNRVLRLPSRHVQARVDWRGALVLAAGLVPLLIVAEQGRIWGFASVASMACYFCGVIGLSLFVWVERRMGDSALLPPRLFKIHAFRTGSAQATVIGIGMFGGLSALPLYLQIVKGASPTRAGLLLLPMVAGMMSTSVIVGRMTARSGRYRKYPIIGSALMIFAMISLSLSVKADAPLWRTDIFMAVFGIGLGMNMQTIQLAMQNSVEARDIGVASSSGTFFRQVGGTLGAAVFLSILFSSAPHKISSAFAAARTTPAFQQAATAHPDQLAQLTKASGSLNDTAFLSSIDPVLAHPFLVGFSQSMDLVFMIGAIVLIPAFALAWLVREVPLRRVSGIAAARAAAAAAAANEAAKAAELAQAAEGSATGGRG